MLFSKRFSGVGTEVKLVTDLTIERGESSGELEELVELLVGHQSKSFVSPLIFVESSLLLEFSHFVFL